MYRECVRVFIFLNFCVSVASGTWSFSPCPLTLPRTSCLRRALTTSPQKTPRGELLPCCPRPRSSPCSSTPPTGPTAGTRYVHKHTEYIRCQPLRMHYSLTLCGRLLRHVTRFVSVSIIIELFIRDCARSLISPRELMSLIYPYVSVREMSQDPEIFR